MIFTMLEPATAEQYWLKVAAFMQPRCNRFWIHWWFRPPNDKREIWEQLVNPSERPPAEPLPPREEMDLGLLALYIERLEPSTVCPNGAGATGPLTPAVLPFLLAQEGVCWWDLHFIDGEGRTRFIATDGGTEHLVWLTSDELEELVAEGVPREAIRIMPTFSEGGQ